MNLSCVFFEPTFLIASLLATETVCDDLALSFSEGDFVHHHCSHASSKCKHTVVTLSHYIAYIYIPISIYLYTDMIFVTSITSSVKFYSLV